MKGGCTSLGGGGGGEYGRRTRVTTVLFFVYYVKALCWGKLGVYYLLSVCADKNM